MFSATERFGASDSSWWISRMPSRSASAASRTSTGRPSTSIVPGVGPHDPAEHLDQRRLPRAVLAQERVDLAGPQVEIDPVQRHHAAVPLRHAAER